MKVRFLLSAKYDLIDIKNYISQDNPTAAKKLISKIKKETNNLAKHPYIGRVIPETKKVHLRELLIGNYRIMYQVTENYINIFAVYEGHKLYRPDKEKE